jgi:hypothetical protein
MAALAPTGAAVVVRLLARPCVSTFRRGGERLKSDLAKPRMTELTEAESEAEAESTIRSPTPEAKPETMQHAAAKAGLPAVALPPPLLPPPSVSRGDTIAAMNQQHAIIENVGGKTVIGSWEPSPLDPTRQMVVFQNKESFLLRYSNQYVTVEVSDWQGRYSLRKGFPGPLVAQPPRPAAISRRYVSARKSRGDQRMSKSLAGVGRRT